MTSSQLVDLVAGYKWFLANKVQVSPDEVYQAGNFAQLDMCVNQELLEESGQLAFVASQEQYSYSPVTVTGATNASPIVISCSSHVFQTGDVIFIGGAVGNTAANGKWTVTRISSTQFSLNGSTGNGAWTSGGTAYHNLLAAVTLRDDLMLFDPSQSQVSRNIIVKSSTQEVDRYRVDFSSVDPGVIVRYYLLDGQTLVLGVQGLPASGQYVTYTFVRKPLPTDNLSATVDPILPSHYDKALYFGTLLQVFDLYVDRPEAAAQYQKILTLYGAELNKAGRLRVKRNFLARQDYTSLEYR